MKDNIQLPPMEVAIDIGSGPDYDRFLIIEVRPWRSMNCSFQGLTEPDTVMNDVKLACKANVRCTDQDNATPVVCHP